MMTSRALIKIIKVDVSEPWEPFFFTKSNMNNAAKKKASFCEIPCVHTHGSGGADFNGFVLRN